MANALIQFLSLNMCDAMLGCAFSMSPAVGIWSGVHVLRFGRMKLCLRNLDRFLAYVGWAKRRMWMDLLEEGGSTSLYVMTSLIACWAMERCGSSRFWDMRHSRYNSVVPKQCVLRDLWVSKDALV